MPISSCEIRYFNFLCLPLHPQMTNGQVLYGQLPWNPPGRERSKGTWL